MQQKHKENEELLVKKDEEHEMTKSKLKEHGDLL